MDVSERVERGAALLDRYCPGWTAVPPWRDFVDLQLKVAVTCGLVAEDASLNAKHAAFDHVLRDADVYLADVGLRTMADRGRAWNEEYEDLTAAWRRALERRLTS
jgi:hypothetical protein